MDEHRSYLLRLWSGRPDRPWRARLECVDTGEVVVFRSVQALACFLAAHPAAATDPRRQPEVRE